MCLHSINNNTQSSQKGSSTFQFGGKRPSGCVTRLRLSYQAKCAGEKLYGLFFFRVYYKHCTLPPADFLPPAFSRMTVYSADDGVNIKTHAHHCISVELVKRYLMENPVAPGLTPGGLFFFFYLNVDRFPDHRILLPAIVSAKS